MGSHNIHTH